MIRHVAAVSIYCSFYSFVCFCYALLFSLLFRSVFCSPFSRPAFSPCLTAPLTYRRSAVVFLRYFLFLRFLLSALFQFLKHKPQKIGIQPRHQRNAGKKPDHDTDHKGPHRQEGHLYTTPSTTNYRSYRKPSY